MPPCHHSQCCFNLRLLFLGVTDGCQGLLVATSDSITVSRWREHWSEEFSWENTTASFFLRSPRNISSCHIDLNWIACSSPKANSMGCAYWLSQLGHTQAGFGLFPPPFPAPRPTSIHMSCAEREENKIKLADCYQEKGGTYVIDSITPSLFKSTKLDQKIIL